MKNAFKKKPLRAALVLLGALAMLHALMYAFTGLSFVAHVGEAHDRGVLVLMLHVLAIGGGGMSLVFWKDWDEL